MGVKNPNQSNWSSKCSLTRSVPFHSYLNEPFCTICIDLSITGSINGRTDGQTGRHIAVLFLGELPFPLFRSVALIFLKKIGLSPLSVCLCVCGASVEGAIPLNQKLMQNIMPGSYSCNIAHADSTEREVCRLAL